jgi:hypothetical protein
MIILVPRSGFKRWNSKGGFPRHAFRKRLSLREVLRSVLRVIMVDLVDGFVVPGTDVYRLQCFNRQLKIDWEVDKLSTGDLVRVANLSNITSSSL